jgi:hypothetical protein
LNFRAGQAPPAELFGLVRAIIERINFNASWRVNKKQHRNESVTEVRQEGDDRPLMGDLESSESRASGSAAECGTGSGFFT